MEYGATVSVSLTPELDTFVKNRIRSGEYQTASEVVQRALIPLGRYETERGEAWDALKAHFRRGASEAERGELLDGDAVFDELRELIEQRGRAREQAGR